MGGGGGGGGGGGRGSIWKFWEGEKKRAIQYFVVVQWEELVKVGQFLLSQLQK